ncbi:MAG TPA: hypothetical protein VK211_12680 [Kamptonema sp.]|nr:hypothetical protein [Kamptonema sp.]
MGLTKHEFEIQKETIEQSIRQTDISILEVKQQIKEQNLEAANWDLETAKEGVRKSKLGYESAKVGNDISEQKLTQLEDQLAYEKAMVYLNKQSLLVQGKSALLSLQQAQTELENNSQLFELKYRATASLESLPME